MSEIMRSRAALSGVFDVIQKIAKKNEKVKLLLPGQPIMLEKYKMMVSER